MVTLKTSHGDITLQLHSEHTPNTVENFLNYAADGFYGGTVFHRVIDGFMIQGGGLTLDMEKKSTRDPIENEANTAKSNRRGTIAMARTGDPHSATAQFFINVKDNDFLDFQSKDIQGWGYCVFGEVVSGMDTVDAIRSVPTTRRDGHSDVPIEDVIIQEVIIL